eukprot:5039-Heterococcus_DN1.PRE.2
MQECNCHKYTQFSDAVHLERTKEALRARSHLGASGTERSVSAVSLYCNALEQVCVRGDQIDEVAQVFAEAARVPLCLPGLDCEDWPRACRTYVSVVCVHMFTSWKRGEHGTEEKVR